MRKLILLVFFALPILTSCRKPDEACTNCPKPPDSTSPGPLKVLWQVPLNPDTAECVSMKPVVFNGNVLYSMLFYHDGYEFLRMVNAQTGTPVWSWDPIWPGETILTTTRFVKDNVFVLSHWGPTYAIDMNTGQNLWAKDYSTLESTSDLHVGRIGDYYYTEHSGALILDTASYYVRVDIANSTVDTLFYLKGEDGYKPHLFPPSLWLSPSGDSILIFQNRQWNFPASDGRVDLYAYNLRTRAFEWQVKDFDPIGNSSVQFPLIHKDKVYLQAQTVLYCFDAATGNKIWSWTVPASGNNLMQCNLLVAENKLFVKPGIGEQLYGLDLNTGNLIAYVGGVAEGAAQMSYHNGIIYYGTPGNGRICAIRPSKAEVIWKERSPNRGRPGGPWNSNASFDNLTISPEHGCLFVSDHYFFMAIKLIE